jgi:hypothetical protein
MKYLLVLMAGVWLGLAFQHLPRRPLFNDTPQTPEGWEPKMRGNWSEEDRATLNRYYNGGK